MNTSKYLLGILALAAFAACDLEKEVEIDLPLYDNRPIVECYLEPGKPFRLLLTRSYGYFDDLGLDSTYFDNTLLSGATVTIAYNGQVDTLLGQLSFDLPPLPIRLYNYTGKNTVPVTPGVEYTLGITMPDGATISGKTVMLPFVPIDSILVQWNEGLDTMARVLTYITDDQTQTNFYRRMINYSTLDSVPRQNFLVTDRIATSPIFAFGTGYQLMEGDTVINTMFHITKDYYDFYESILRAVAGNRNPFAQPSPIIGNVTGSANPLGIFTCLVYDRDTTIIMR
ncbi:MAG: DUF4249 domain-containing protein [Saprospiraceae bacterium]